MTGVTPHIHLKPIWLKAAILGGLWASIEIIIGSFFHNLRLPFAGTILAANSTILMIAFYQMWPEKGLIWRAGLIAALMKSVSPSAIILGPMIGIMSEALIVEFFIRVFGNNLVSLSIAGALSVSSALIHKVGSLLILYGFNIVKLYVDIFKYLAKQISIENPDPWLLLIIVSSVYLLFGITSALVGYRIGKNTLGKKFESRGFRPKIVSKDNLLAIDPQQKFFVGLFFVHVLLIPTGLVLLNYVPLVYGMIFILVYSMFCIYHYKRSLRRLKKPVFWGQLFLLTFLAAIFWNGFNNHESFFNVEGLLVGLEMNLRALFVVIAFSAFGVELRNPVIRDFLFKKGFDKIYAALGLSFTALPVMIEAMPRPKYFLLHPIESFSNMMKHAKEWLNVFEQKATP
ncbi:MAG: hypothetical protein K9G76_00685 [Bacteroidales bacterium]|nr:hypothetical protein [Bacteroidales bacterium]MCF8402629.1 hypothetical protein [Bacteroidales bacterium]